MELGIFKTRITSSILRWFCTPTASVKELDWIHIFLEWIGLSVNQAYGDYASYDTTGGISTQGLYNYDLGMLSEDYIDDFQDGVFETAFGWFKTEQIQFPIHAEP